MRRHSNEVHSKLRTAPLRQTDRRITVPPLVEPVTEDLHSTPFPLHDTNVFGKGFCNDVKDFYDSFQDSITSLFPDQNEPSPSPGKLESSNFSIVKFCCDHSLTSSEIEDQYELFAAIELRLPENLRVLEKQFASASSLSRYIRRFRKWKCKVEGWKIVSLKLGDTENNTGVFRSGLDILRQLLSSQSKSKEPIIPFSPYFRDDERISSAPWNSEGMKSYSKCEQLGAKIVCVDLFADGTTLSASGSQSANIVRVRFSNLRSHRHTWHELGICPFVSDEDGTKTKAVLQRERSQLFQRYLYISLFDLIEASIFGFVINGTLYVTRLLMLVSDQPQERLFLCLKGSGGFHDCSHCLMPSREKLISKRASTASVKHSNVESDIHSRTINDIRDTQRRQQEAKDRVISEQISTRCAEERDVVKTLKAQLLVAKHVASEIFIRALAEDKKNAVASARSFLEKYGGLELPPALAAFEGLDSFPYRLYDTVTFDKLHAFDLGLLRELADKACVTLTNREGVLLSAAKLSGIANRRLLDIPRAAHLPQVPVFLENPKQLQPAVSGRVRRQHGCFLWVVLMGLDMSMCPDEDPLVQAALAASYVQSELLSVNKPPLCENFTSSQIKQLQKDCFELGKLVQRAVGGSVNTKLHRVMRHVGRQIENYGNMRIGFSDKNETLHKSTKAAFKATNKRRRSVTPQLLQARLKVEQDELGAPSLESTRILLTRAFNNSSANTVSNVGAPSLPGRTAATSDCNKHIADVQSIIDEGHSPMSSVQLILKKLHPTTLMPIWRRKLSVRIHPIYTWLETERCKHTSDIFASEEKDGRGRFDFVQYKDREVIRIGQLEAILNNLEEINITLVVVKRLMKIPPEPGNCNVVKKYKFNRYSFAQRRTKCGSDCQLDVVPLESVLRPAIVVLDPYDSTKRHCVDYRAQHFPKTREERLRSRFFEITNFQFTSITEP